MGKTLMGAVIGFVVGGAAGFCVFCRGFASLGEPGSDFELYVAGISIHVAGLLGGVIGTAFGAITGARHGECQAIGGPVDGSSPVVLKMSRGTRAAIRSVLGGSASAILSENLDLFPPAASAHQPECQLECPICSALLRAPAALPEP